MALGYRELLAEFVLGKLTREDGFQIERDGRDGFPLENVFAGLQAPIRPATIN
jgi:hypothetical protein